MNDRYFMRYSRQILLEDIAIDGQQKLLASRVLIVGLGGLGAPAALYLAGAGIGTLVLADDDEVHLSNLQRQILFTTEDINQPKAQITRQRLNQLNPDIELIALQDRLSGDNLRREVAWPTWCWTARTTWRRARRLTPPAWQIIRRLSRPARWVSAGR